MTKSEIKYEDKYVCFIDLLGFKNAIRNSTHAIFDSSPAYIKDALSAMEKSIDNNEFFFRGASIIQVSDSIIISCPVEPNNLYYLIDRVVRLQQELLSWGFPTRGAITKGKLFHEGTIIFGPAYTKAVELEGKVEFPIVMLSDEIIEDLNVRELPNAELNGFNKQFKFLLNTLTFIETSINNNSKIGVNFYQNWPFENGNYGIVFSDLKLIIENGLANTDPHIQEKYHWLAYGFNEFIVNNAITRFGEATTKFTIPTNKYKFDFTIKIAEIN